MWKGGYDLGGWGGLLGGFDANFWEKNTLSKNDFSFSKLMKDWLRDAFRWLYTLSYPLFLGMVASILTIATDSLPRLAEVEWMGWFVSGQPMRALVAWDVMLALLALLVVPTLGSIFVRVRRTHSLNAKPLTLLHRVTAGAVGLLGGCLLLKPEGMLSALGMALAPSAIPASHLPAWITACSIVSVLFFMEGPSRKKIGGVQRDLANNLTDDPISHASEDILGRGWFVKRLKKSIKSLPKPCNRFVLALDGRWGDGKTSILNLLGNQLESDGAIILVRFNAWLFDDEQSAIRGFFQALEAAINTKYFYPSLRRLLGRYSQALGAADRDWLRVLFGGSRGDDYQSTRMELEDAIRALDQQIVVFVDDIDRLEFQRLISVFRLVNLLADFQDIVFILAFDRVQIAQTLEKNGRDNTFIEKIVQRTEPLPRIPQSVLDGFIDKGLEVLLDSVRATAEERTDLEKRFSYLYQKHLRDLFTNLRSAKDFLNGVAARVPLLREEVNLTDLVFLEVVHSRFPTLHQDLWPNRWCYVNPAWARGKRDFVVSLVGSAARDANLKRAGEHIKSLVSGFDHKEAALELLKAIFPEVENALVAMGRHVMSEREMREGKRLCHPDCLRRAFEQSVQEGELSDARLDALREKWLNEPAESRGTKIAEDLQNLHFQQLLPDFIERMIDRLDKTPSAFAVPIIRALAELSGQFSDQEALPFSSELRAARNFAIMLLPKLSAEEMRGLVDEVITSASAIDFAVGVVFFVTKAKDREPGFEAVYSAIDPNHAIAVLHARLEKRYLKEKLNVFEDYSVKAPILVLSCWSGVCGHRADVMRYVDEVLAKSPESVAALIRPFYRGTDWGFEYQSLSNIFDVARIAELATEVSAQVNDDGRRVIDVFLKTKEHVETKRIENLINGLSQFERDFLEGLKGQPWARVENANALHLKRLFDEGFIERTPMGGEFMVDPRTHFGARLTTQGENLVASLT